MKNKITYWVLLLLLLTATTSILAQEECGTELTQVQIDYMNATREVRKNINLSQFKSNTVTIIPMVAHIIRNTGGSGGLSTIDLNIAMANLNEAYEEVGFEFELCEINYIDNTAYVAVEKSFEQGSVEHTMGTTNRVAGKVNVFFASNISGSGWASFPGFKDGYDIDWIVIKNSAATKSTFAHELGHWFNLYHTHEKDWDEHMDHDVGITEAELVRREGEGTNCGNDHVGDELCGTPADPMLKYKVRDDCVYIGNDKDAKGDLYTPDTHNIMSYSIGKCRTSFSPEQIARMQTSYAIDRSGSLSPCTTSLDCEITAISVSNTTTCNDNGNNDTTDDYFTGDVSIYYFGRPASGGLTLSVLGGSSHGDSYFNVDANKHIFNNVRMPANGEPVSMTARFNTNCSFTDNNVHRGTSCGPCHINEPTLAWLTLCNHNGTPEVTDDFFEARINITCSNWPTSGTLDITGDAQLSIPVNQLNNDQEVYQLPFVVFPAKPQISLTATFSDANCSATNTVAGRYPCSEDCPALAVMRDDISNTHVESVGDNIWASNEILSGADVTYDAGNRIKLTPGFRAHNGSKFHAYIDGCLDGLENKEELFVSELDATLGLRNYPNPFTGQTTMEFKLSNDTPVTLFVSDVTGRQIAVLLDNDQKTEGIHTIIFDGNNYPAGMYYYTIQAGEYYGTQKMILAK